jgi:hypothetical protein
MKVYYNFLSFLFLFAGASALKSQICSDRACLDCLGPCQTICQGLQQSQQLSNTLTSLGNLAQTLSQDPNCSDSCKKLMGGPVSISSKPNEFTAIPPTAIYFSLVANYISRLASLVCNNQSGCEDWCYEQSGLSNKEKLKSAEISRQPSGPVRPSTKTTIAPKPPITSTQNKEKNKAR